MIPVAIRNILSITPPPPPDFGAMGEEEGK